MSDHADSPLESKRDNLHRRMQQSQEAIAAFARIADQYAALRLKAPTAEARDRIDQLLKLNSDTLAVVKRGLVITEDDLGRADLDSE